MSRQPGEKKLSKAVLELKFMKKSKEKAELQEENEERQQLYQDQLSTLHEGADLIIRLDSYVDCMSFLPCRLSFGGMDPDIEKLNEDKLTGMYKVEKPEPPELITEMKADMSALEMAMALGGNPKKRTSDHLDNGEESKEFDKKKSGRFFVPRGRGRGNSRGAGDGQGRGRGRGDSRGFGREKRMHIFSGDSKSSVQDNSGDDFQYDDKDDNDIDNKNKSEAESKDGGNHWSFNRGGYRDGGRGRGGAGFEGREGSFRGGGRGRGNEGFGRGRGDGGFGRGRGVGGFGARDRGRGAGSFEGRGRGRDSQGFRGREGFGGPGRGRGTRGFGGRSKGRDGGFAERNQGNERDEDFLDSSHERGEGNRSYSPKAGGSGIMKGDTIDGNRESMRNNNKGKGIGHGREAEAENFNNFDGAMEKYLQSITCDNPRINRGKRQPKRKRGRHSAYRDNMDGSSPVVKGEDAKSFKGEDGKSFKDNKVNDLDQFIKKLRVESGTKPEKME